MTSYTETKSIIGAQNIVSGMFGSGTMAPGNWSPDRNTYIVVTNYPVIQMYLRVTLNGSSPETPQLASKVTPEAYVPYPSCGPAYYTLPPEYVSETKGGDGDTWGVGLTPALVNSPGFGIILYPPNSGVSKCGLGFNIPTEATVTGLSVNIGWRHTCLLGIDQSSPNQIKEEVYYIDSFSVTAFFSIECTSGLQQCSDGHLYSCVNSHWVDQGANMSCPGTECNGSEIKCVGKDSYMCANGYLFLSKPNDYARCPGTECSGGTTCSDGYRYQCNNGWYENIGASDCCGTNDTKCLNGHLYRCDGNQNWVDQGESGTCPGSQCTSGVAACVGSHLYSCVNGYFLDGGTSHTCPGGECSSGQTECVGGNRYDCTNGWWVDQGPDTVCPGTGCTGNVTHCIDDHRFTCENGYDVDKGVDKTCPGSECTGTDTHCDGDHLIGCENGWVVDKGVDITCQNTPKGDNTIIYAAVGALAVGGIILLLASGKKKN